MTRMRRAILLTTTISSASSRHGCFASTAAFLSNCHGKRQRLPSCHYFASSSSLSSSSSSTSNGAETSSLMEQAQNDKDEQQQQQLLENNNSKGSFRIYYNDVYEVNLPPNHRFPMSKYRKVREMLQSKIKNLTQEEQDCVHCEFQISPLATIEELSTTHCPSYIQRFLNGNMTDMEIRNTGFPWSAQGVNRALSSVGGTVAAATFICDQLQQLQEEEEENSTKENGTNRNDSSSPPPPIWAAHVAGGTHHAFHDYGEGFCIFSDIAVAANVIRQRYAHLIKRILIIDLDVHQGNGNAVLFQNRNDVMTFSIHCQSNYFSKKEISDLDVEVPAGCNDDTYLATLRHWLSRIEKEGGEYDFVFYQAGVDVLEDDRLGKMSLSKGGVVQRNKLVYDFAKRRNIPMVITMGGGYPKDREDWSSILNAHSNVYFQAHRYISDCCGGDGVKEGEKEDVVESL